MKITKPTVTEILALHEDCKRRYSESGLFGAFDEDEKLYELDFKSELLLPVQFEAEGVILPTGRDLVDTCVDHTNISNVRAWVSRKGESTKSKEEQELLRKFGLGVLYRNNVEASISPIRAGAKHYWLHGLCILKDVWDADRWIGRPERTEDESEETYAVRIDEWRAEHHDSIPVVILPVHPKNIMLDPYYEGGMFIFETHEELCYNVKQKVPRWGNPGGKRVTDTVEHISFWTKDYRCELYDREPVLKVAGGVAKHSYGFIPYVAIDTGLGNIAADGAMKKRYVGILRYVKGLLFSESRDYSIGDIILKKNAWPWGYLKGPNAKSVAEISQKFGEYQVLPDGVDIVDVVPKLPPADLLTWLTVSAQYLAAHAAPNVVRGLGEAGVRSGADRRLIIAEASARYTYSSDAFRYGVAKVLSNCARIMKNVVPGDINVWAKTPTDEFDIVVKKDKMKEPFTFYVEFAPISEEDEYRRHDDLERLVKSGLVVKNWARKQMSNVDADAMELEEEIQRLKDDPLLAQMVGQYAAGKLAEAIAKRTEAENINLPMALPVGPAGPAGTPQPMAPGRQLSPPIPNVPPLGSAENIQNELAKLRSQTSMTEQGRSGGGNR